MPFRTTGAKRLPNLPRHAELCEASVQSPTSDRTLRISNTSFLIWARCFTSFSMTFFYIAVSDAQKSLLSLHRTCILPGCCYPLQQTHWPGPIKTQTSLPSKVFFFKMLCVGPARCRLCSMLFQLCRRRIGEIGFPWTILLALLCLWKNNFNFFINSVFKSGWAAPWFIALNSAVLLFQK